jgi:hypothetical protein
MIRTTCLFVALAACAAACAQDAAPPSLLAGAKPQFRPAGEKTAKWTDQLPQERGPVRARWLFDLAEIPAWQSLTVQSSPGVEGCVVNGRRVPLPVKGLRYTTLPGVPTIFLQTGSNSLELEFNVTGSRRGRPALPAVSLIPLRAADLDFQTGPLLGNAGASFFTLGCRTNMPAKVTLEVGGKKWESREGLVHAFRATHLPQKSEQVYSLTARVVGSNVTKRIGPFHTRTLPSPGEPVRFAALGDSRSFPQDWAQVAAAVLARKPMFVVFSGDMVTDGHEDRLWDEQFFSVARAYHATIPNFYVNGNHEGGSPLVGRLLPIADRVRWKAVVGNALFIGIDGAADWSDKSENLKWLETALNESDERFIFLNSHYPPWSSGPHGAGNEPTSLAARKYILPLMKKYGATAFLCGHEHNYERCEPPDGVTVIVSGGAGAPLYKRVLTEEQNPSSKVFACVHNFCLFDIDGDRCTMQALTPEGKVLDTKVWPARPRK